MIVNADDMPKVMTKKDLEKAGSTNEGSSKISISDI